MYSTFSFVKIRLQMYMFHQDYDHLVTRLVDGCLKELLEKSWFDD